MTPSDLERAFFFQCRASGVPLPQPELRFHETRRWRFDFAWPTLMLAVEIEGGTWSSGRHTRGPGFENDCEKMNEAAIAGWTVLRFPGGMVTDGRAIQVLMRAVEAKQAGQNKE